MPQSHAQIYLHLVFSTKHRQPFLQDAQLRDRVHRYLAGICNNLGSQAQIVGGVEDHVHLLCRFSKTLTVADLVRDLKRDSSKWIKTEQPQLANFHWQQGYGTFSVSPGHLASLTNYIQQQEAHHKTETYQDEFRRICEKYGVEIDERYVWD